MSIYLTAETSGVLPSCIEKGSKVKVYNPNERQVYEGNILEIHRRKNGCFGMVLRNVSVRPFNFPRQKCRLKEGTKEVRFHVRSLNTVPGGHISLRTTVGPIFIYGQAENLLDASTALF